MDTVLNVVWALLCVGALVCNWLRERRSARPGSGRVRFLRGLSVFLAVLSLFPCISISDDYARLQDFNLIPSLHPSFQAGRSANLLLVQLEETEHIRPVAPFVLVLLLCCFLVVFVEQSATRRSFHWHALGRAPPAF